MASLFFKIRPFSTKKICFLSQTWIQSKFKTMSNIELTLKKIAKISTFCTKWQNFAKSGHTGESLYYQWENRSFDRPHILSFFLFHLSTQQQQQQQKISLLILIKNRSIRSDVVNVFPSNWIIVRIVARYFIF